MFTRSYQTEQQRFPGNGLGPVKRRTGPLRSAAGAQSSQTLREADVEPVKREADEPVSDQLPLPGAAAALYVCRTPHPVRTAAAAAAAAAHQDAQQLQSAGHVTHEQTSTVAVKSMKPGLTLAHRKWSRSAWTS